VLVLFVENARVGEPAENLNGNLALKLGVVVKLDYAVDAFKNLPLHYSIAWKARAEKHDVCLETSLVESALNPADKLSRDFLEKK